MGVFFSSRRRHTRFDCDWSSDVCSSDLRLAGLLARCLALVQKEEQLPEGKREELARAYGDQAMTLLRRAVTAGLDGESAGGGKRGYVGGARVNYKKKITAWRGGSADEVE